MCKNLDMCKQNYTIHSYMHIVKKKKKNELYKTLPTLIFNIILPTVNLAFAKAKKCHLKT